MSGYIKIHVSWTLHHDTSRYTEIQNHDTCILDASWCWHGLIVSESQVLQVNELVEMHGSCPRPLHLLCARPCSCCKVGTPARRNAREIHEGYMRDTCGIHAGYIRDTCICRGSRIHEGYMRDTSKIHIGIHVFQMYPERYVSEMQDTCGIQARYMYLQG